jgi:hypothetical protein
VKRSPRPVHLAVCVVVATWVAGGGVACGDDDAPARPAGRGIAAPRDDVSSQAPAPSAARAGSTRVGRPAPLTTTPRRDEAERVGLTPPAEAVPPTPPGAGRDFESELRVLVGDPSTCFADVEAPPETLDIVVAATTTSSGVITRVSATAPNLDADQLRCIERRLGNARFRAPVEAAPRTVVTTVSLRYRAREADPPDPGPTGGGGRAAGGSG